MHTQCVRKPEGKRPLGIPRHRLENNIRMKINFSKSLFHAISHLILVITNYHFNSIILYMYV
jgi:hypothetical protein